ncbi:hypothetical protein AAMO2058_001001700 [Amorphochlora amoebiformis]
MKFSGTRSESNQESTIYCSNHLWEVVLMTCGRSYFLRNLETTCPEKPEQQTPRLNWKPDRVSLKRVWYTCVPQDKSTLCMQQMRVNRVATQQSRMHVKADS